MNNFFPRVTTKRNLQTFPHSFSLEKEKRKPRQKVPLQDILHHNLKRQDKSPNIQIKLSASYVQLAKHNTLEISKWEFKA